MSIPSVRRVVYKLMANGERRRLTPKGMAGIASWPPERFHSHEGSPDLIGTFDGAALGTGHRLVTVAIGAPVEGWVRLFTLGGQP